MKKYQLLTFISYNTVESQIMRDQLAGNADVKALAEKHFTLTIYLEGADSAPILRYQVTKFPTLIATTADGTEVDRFLGYAPPQETAAFLEAAAQGESSMAALAKKVAATDAAIEDRLAFAEAALRRGKNVDALRELKVCLDQASAPAAKNDRRHLQRVLSRLVALGKVESAALELVVARRDALEKSLSPHFPGPITTVFAFNDALREYDRNVDLYLRLPGESPLRERLFPAVFSQLVMQRRYQDAVGGPDLEGFVNDLYPKGSAKAAAAADENSDRRHIVSHRRRVTEVACNAVEALLGVGQLEKARRIAGRALESFEDDTLKARLQWAAQRAESPAAAEFAAWLEVLKPSSPTH